MRDFLQESMLKRLVFISISASFIVALLDVLHVSSSAGIMFVSVSIATLSIFIFRKKNELFIEKCCFVLLGFFTGAVQILDTSAWAAQFTPEWANERVFGFIGAVLVYSLGGLIILSPVLFINKKSPRDLSESRSEIST